MDRYVIAAQLRQVGALYGVDLIVGAESTWLGPHDALDIADALINVAHSAIELNRRDSGDGVSPT